MWSQDFSFADMRAKTTLKLVVVYLCAHILLFATILITVESVQNSLHRLLLGNSVDEVSGFMLCQYVYTFIIVSAVSFFS